MLSENVYVNTLPVVTGSVLKSWDFIWKCKNCNSEIIVTTVNIEDMINSDPHDPLQDYLICPVCNRSYGLFKGVQGRCRGNNARLWADGTFVYLRSLGIDERVV